MPNIPIRVAVISRNLIVRSGVVALIAQLEARALVTQAESADTALTAHDVAIYDLDAVADLDDYDDLRRLFESRTPVIGLVYDKGRATLPPVVEDARQVITLSATPAQLMAILDETTRDIDHDTRAALPFGLTEREIAVLELIGAGLSNEKIAKQLFLSINSVKTYIRTAYRKIGVGSRQGAMLWTLQHGLSGGPSRQLEQRHQPSRRSELEQHVWTTSEETGSRRPRH